MKLVLLIAFAVLVGLGCVHYVQPRLFSGIAFRSVFTGLKLFFEHVKHAEEPCVEALDTIFSLKPSVFNPNTFPGDVRWQVSELENAAVLEPSARLTRIIIPSSDGQSDKIVATWVDILQDGRRSIPADDENYLMADYTHVLYLHGGVFVAGSSQSHSGLVSKLVRRLGNARALVVDYRLAPEHSLQQAVEDCTAAYIYLVMEKQVSPWRIVVIGDSAGGNLVYQMQAAILSRAFPQPVATVMISPWLDLYLDTDLHRKNAQTDKMLDISFLQKVADIVTRDDADTKLAFSPAHVNAVVTTPFPTSLVVSSSSELLHQDSVAIVKKLRAAGVKVEHKATAKHPHVFPCFSDILPEGNAALNHIVSWIREIVPY